MTAATMLRRAKATFLRERADELLRASVDAGDADLWGNSIRHATVDAALALADEAHAAEQESNR